jgi:hypothetical protein
MRQNFNELFSKLPPESQERVNARSSELLDVSARFDETLIRLDQFASIAADPVSENALSEPHTMHD